MSKQNPAQLKANTLGVPIKDAKTGTIYDPKRRRKRTRRPTSRVNTGQLMSLIQSEIGRATKRTDYSIHGKKFISCLVNPFGTGEQGGEPVSVAVPDGDNRKTVLYRLNGYFNFSGSNGTSGFVQLVGLNGSAGTMDQSFQITYGADALDPTATMTTVYEAFDNEYVAAQGLMANTGQKSRLISMGLRIAPNNLDTADGVLEAFETDALARTAAATYVRNDVLMHAPMGQSYSIQEGITVRRGCDPNYKLFHVPNTAIYTGSETATKNNWGTCPIIRFTGLSATTVLHITWTALYETLPLYNNPQPCSLSPYEPELDNILHLTNTWPMHSKGNSFRSFMKAVGKGLNKATQYLASGKPVALVNNYLGRGKKIAKNFRTMLDDVESTAEGLSGMLL